MIVHLEHSPEGDIPKCVPYTLVEWFLFDVKLNQASRCVMTDLLPDFNRDYTRLIWGCNPSSAVLHLNFENF